MTDPRPTFTGPDGAEYTYADPDEAPNMDDADSTKIPPVEGAPEEPVEVVGESTPGEV